MTSTSSISSANPILPNDVIGNVIFPNLSLPALAICTRVCKAWNKMATEHLKAFSYDNAFGPKEWYIYFGSHLKNVPRLPSNIGGILSSSCPFWTDKKVFETHVLVLIPATVNGQPLTLKTLGELVQHPRSGGKPTKYEYFNLGEYVDQPAQSHWALLTRTVIEGSRNKPYKDQQAIVSSYSRKTKMAYEIPTVLDAAVCNFMEYVRSGTWLYSQSPLTFTWCQEKYNASWNLFVGGGGEAGLRVDIYDDDADEDCGAGGLRKSF
jgi:hypothetical protein